MAIDSGKEYIPSNYSDTQLDKIEGQEYEQVKARHILAEQGTPSDYLRLRAIPFADEVGTFLAEHPVNWVVELNSDGQMHSLLKIDFAEHAGAMRSLAHNDGLPLTAQRVVQAVRGEKESAS